MIPLFKVAMSPEAPEAVRKVLESGYIGQGPKVEEFEKALSTTFGEEVLTMNSCTSALDLALHLIGVAPGDEVISTPITCTATNGVVVNRGAKLVWADVDPNTGNINPASVERLITKRTKAVIAVDWGGRICDFPALREVVGLIPLIEDAAHDCVLTTPHYHGHQRGDYIAWSFQAIKHLTTGDGGALRVPPWHVERARLLRWYGLDRRSSESFRCKQTIEEAGYKYHMNDIAAAIGLANIELTKSNVEKHRNNAAFYHEALSEHRHISLPRKDKDSSWWLFTILVPDQALFIKLMKQRGVECSPVHSRNDRHPPLRGYSNSLMGTENFAAYEVAIPVGWWLSKEDREHVVESLKAVIESFGMR